MEKNACKFTKFSLLSDLLAEVWVWDAVSRGLSERTLATHVPNGNVNQSEEKGRIRKEGDHAGLTRSHETTTIVAPTRQWIWVSADPPSFPRSKAAVAVFCGFGVASWKARRYCATQDGKGDPIWPTGSAARKKRGGKTVRRRFVFTRNLTDSRASV